MDARRASLLSRLLSMRYGMAIAVLVLVVTLNSTLLFFSQLLQQSNARLYHHGEGKSYMSINVASDLHSHEQEEANEALSPSAVFGGAINTISAAFDNIAGANQEHILNSPTIDLVYTWVNGSDPRQIKALNEVKRAKLTRENGTMIRICNDTESAEEGHCYKDEETASRFQDNQELRYSLRSVWKYTPWVRNIYLVTNGQIPSWLNVQHPRMHVIPHSAIFANTSHLPTFSSPAIEANIHRIPGLSEHFIYLNDDVMFGREVSPSDFYTAGSGQRVYLAWHAPDCADSCSGSWVGDGFCDVACNVSSCNWDNGDCFNVTAGAPGLSSGSWNWGGNGGTDAREHCSAGCLDTWLGDRYCDRACRNPECGMDAGDCGMDLVFQNVHGLNVQPSQVLGVLAGSYSTPEEPPTINVGSITEGDDLNLASVLYFNLSAVTLRTGSTTPHTQEQTNLGTTAANTGSTSAQITEAAYSHPTYIRTATVSPRHNVLIVYLNAAGMRWAHSRNTASPSGANPTDPAEPSANVTSTTSQQDDDGRIFISFTVNYDQENRIVDYMFYLKFNSHSPSPTTSTPLPIADSTSGPHENPSSQQARQLLSLWEQFQPEKSEIDYSDDTSTFTATANPKLEEKTLRRVFKLGFRTQEQIDEEKRLIAKSGREGIDLVREQENPWALRRSAMVSGINVALGSSDDSSPSGRTSMGSRRLLDHYGDSLKHVNNLLNKAFTPDSRRVPAHMPHYLQRSIIKRMQSLWKKEFEVTSSHQTRAGDDMQYAFSYFHYMMHERRPYNFTTVFDQELDVNGDGILDHNEIRTIAATLARSEAAHPKPNPRTSFQNWNAWAGSRIEDPPDEPAFIWLDKCDSLWLKWMPELAPPPVASRKADEVVDEATIRQAKSNLLQKEAGQPEPVQQVPSSSPVSTPPRSERPFDRLHEFNITAMRRDWNMTKDDLLSCAEALKQVEAHYKARLVNKFEMGNTEENVAFLMVPTNRTVALRGMDAIRANRNKFVCLNDNINHTNPHAEEVIETLHDFFAAMYPHPSPFELPEGQVNKFLHTDDLYAARAEIHKRKNTIYVVVVAVIVLLLVALRLFSRSPPNVHRPDDRQGGGGLRSTHHLRHPDPVILRHHDV